MALDKLVDSSQLDSDLTSVANAIRTKGGTSAQLAFPAGFVSAIGDIPSGGGLTMESVMVKTWPSGAVSTSFSGAILGGQFYDRDSITSFSAPNVTEIGEKAFYSCGELVSFSFPSVTLVKAQAFSYCSKLVDMYLPNATINGEQCTYASVLTYIVCNVMSGDVTYQFAKNGALIAVDAVTSFTYSCVFSPKMVPFSRTKVPSVTATA